MISTRYENKFPDCLFVKLHGDPIRQAKQSISSLLLTSISQKKSKLKQHIELQLTIRFGEHQFKVKGGSISFGLRKGCLKLNIVNGKIPLETIGITPPFRTFFEMELQQEKSRENEGSGGVSVTQALNIKAKTTGKEAKKFKKEVYQVYTKGTEENPIWVFHHNENEEIVTGFLSKVKIGILEIHDKPCLLEAIFEIQDEDVKLTTATGFWDRNIGRNRLAILERAYFLKIIRPQLQPYISRAELQYE